MKATLRQRLAARKRQIQRRLDKAELGNCAKPVFTASTIRYEIADRVRGLACGGIGAMHLLAGKIGLIDAINKGLPLLKVHLLYHESDHVLNIAYNALSNGTCLQDIEPRRNDAVFLDALGARRIPDPTTAGDFCRRFDAAAINRLQDIFDDVRIGVWRQQPADFFDQAILDVDGTLVETTGNGRQAGSGVGIPVRLTAKRPRFGWRIRRDGGRRILDVPDNRPATPGMELGRSIAQGTSCPHLPTDGRARDP